MSEPMRAWELGTRLEERELPPVSRLALIRYAGASGDFNPIHTIDEEAHRAGLRGIIQHGMLTMAQMALPISSWQEDGFVEHLQVRFVGMLYLDDVLVTGGTVVEVEETGNRVTFDLYARTRDGRPIAKGTLRFRWLPDPEPEGTMRDLIPMTTGG